MNQTLKLIQDYLNEHNIETMHVPVLEEYLYVYKTTITTAIAFNDHNQTITITTNDWGNLRYIIIDLTDPNALQQLLTEITKLLKPWNKHSNSSKTT